MKSVFCKTCNKSTGHKRKLGVGTVLALVLTLGSWLLVIPFYPIRCIVCGTDPNPTETIMWLAFVVVGFLLETYYGTFINWSAVFQSVGAFFTGLG